MRDSAASLMAHVYNDPNLRDVAGLVASLPDLPLGAVGGPAGAAVRGDRSRRTTITASSIFAW